MVSRGMRVVAAEEARERLGRLGPVDDRDSDQEQAKHDGRDDERAVLLHRSGASAGSLTIPGAAESERRNRLRGGRPRADDEPMDETRSWRGPFGAALSVAALGFAVVSLLGSHQRACSSSAGSL